MVKGMMRLINVASMSLANKENTDSLKKMKQSKDLIADLRTHWSSEFSRVKSNNNHWFVCKMHQRTSHEMAH